MVAAGILPLRLEGATLTRRGRRLVGPVDLEIGPRGLSIVIGPNGAGKTSLLRMMHGLERPTAGRVLWAVPEKRARARQSFVFQSPVLMHRSIVENVAYPLRLRGQARAPAREAALVWLERVGLAEEPERPAHVLSGGERQKMALARALVIAPEILFLDEPCASLDGRATREIEGILREALSRGVRIVMSTHDLGQARRLADEILFLHHGRILEAAPAERFFACPATPEAAAFLRGDIVE